MPESLGIDERSGRRALGRRRAARRGRGEYGDVVHLLAYTGLRFDEMAGLRVRRVGFLRKRLTVAESASEVGATVEDGRRGRWLSG